jgi:hypothetical protein
MQGSSGGEQKSVPRLITEIKEERQPNGSELGQKNLVSLVAVNFCE